jgi:hypothetical protein
MIGLQQPETGQVTRGRRRTMHADYQNAVAVKEIDPVKARGPSCGAPHFFRA